MKIPNWFFRVDHDDWLLLRFEFLFLSESSLLSRFLCMLSTQQLFSKFEAVTSWIFSLSFSTLFLLISSIHLRFTIKISYILTFAAGLKVNSSHNWSQEILDKQRIKNLFVSCVIFCNILVFRLSLSYTKS